MIPSTIRRLTPFLALRLCGLVRSAASQVDWVCPFEGHQKRLGLVHARGNFQGNVGASGLATAVAEADTEMTKSGNLLDISNGDNGLPTAPSARKIPQLSTVRSWRSLEKKGQSNPCCANHPEGRFTLSQRLDAIFPPLESHDGTN